jgi:hypothetical protein
MIATNAATRAGVKLPWPRLTDKVPTLCAFQRPQFAKILPHVAPRLSGVECGFVGSPLMTMKAAKF